MGRRYAPDRQDGPGATDHRALTVIRVLSAANAPSTDHAQSGVIGGTVCRNTTHNEFRYHR